MLKRKELSLTEGNIFGSLLSFSLPIILGSLIQQLYIMTDAVIVGQFVGKTGLAAIDSVHTLFKFPLNFMNGLTAGATILVSGYFGARDREGLHCSIRTALTIAFVLGAVCSVLGFLLTPMFLSWMSVPGDIVNKTAAYTRIYFSGLWAMVIYNMAAGIIRAFGDSGRPLYVLILCSVLNIIGDCLLVGVLGFGVQGAAAATVIAQIVSAVVVLKMLAETERAGGQVLIWHLHFCREHMSDMLRTGLPLALQSVLFPIANTIVQASINSMGTDSIAAWGICDKLDMLIWLVADAMGPALTTYTAQNIGAGRNDRVKRGAIIGASMSVGCVAAISLVLFLASGFFGRWFIDSNEAGVIVPMSVHYMKLMTPFFVFYALGEAFSGVCCGTGDTTKPMITTLITICLLRVICIWLILPQFRSMECIAWIYIASWIAVGAAFSLMVHLRLANIKSGSPCG